jgi:aryl-alcohol dehydrogenase-like predicted oxidoreductase
MQFRTFGRLGWKISDIGHGMWGLAGWTGSDDAETEKSLDLSVSLGCNFFDTAWAYGEGKSERILGALLKRHKDKRLYVATKIPPKNGKWPSQRGFTLDECFPPEHIREYTEKSLRNLGVETIDLQQFHVWEDSWAGDERWQRTVEDLKKEGKITAMGVSVNRWEPDNVLDTLRTGHIDAVQVIYNIFDQAPEDKLFPLCKTLNIGVIARVPFDEGTLTGTLTNDTTFPKGDWRGTYFVEENLRASVAHADKLKHLMPQGVTMAEMALRFVISNPRVHTTIPGMRKEKNVRANLTASDEGALPGGLLNALRAHRWDRTPTEWSQ